MSKNKNIVDGHKFSNQALGANMMALQESLLNELDIVPILKGLELEETEGGLVVKNPPTVRFTDSSVVTEGDLLGLAKEQK